MKILITGGGSEEPIDKVRAVCNTSTGHTASFLSDYFSKKGFNVTALISERSEKPLAKNVRIITYKTFLQLKKNLEEECLHGKYDAILHTAAVSDYSPDKIEIDGKTFNAGEISKIPSGSEIVIRMKKNPKLIDFIKKYSGTKCKVIAFKLTNNATALERYTAVHKIFDSNIDKSLTPDLIVSNDLSEITPQLHPCTIFKKDMTILGIVINLEELASLLYNYLSK